MAVPKKKMSKPKTRTRRSHDALQIRSRSVCPQCQAIKEAHRVCPTCGHYRGRQIFEVEKEEEV